MGDVMRMREPFFILVDNQVDRALRPARDRLRFMVPDDAEAETSKKLSELRGGMVIDGKLDELHAETLRAWRQFRNVVAGEADFFP